MASDGPSAKFASKEEFEALCGYLSARLHYLNRTSMGESKFVWELADLMKRAGKVFAEHYDDKDTKAAFGDGYTAGTIERKDRPIALHALMYPSQG